MEENADRVINWKSTFRMAHVRWNARNCGEIAACYSFTRFMEGNRVMVYIRINIYQYLNVSMCNYTTWLTKWNQFWNYLFLQFYLCRGKFIWQHVNG